MISFKRAEKAQPRQTTTPPSIDTSPEMQVRILKTQIIRMFDELEEKDKQIEKLTMQLEERNNLISQAFRLKVEDIS